MKVWIRYFNSKNNIARSLVFCLFLTIIFSIMSSIVTQQFPESSSQFKKEIYLQNRNLKANYTQDLSKRIVNLSRTDSLIIKKCGSGSKGENTAQLERICSPEMRFLPPSKSRNLTALVSFPGSGNTWVRQLLEEATGVYTGSIYCDSTLKKSGFLGENITSSSVMVIKTHIVYNRLMKGSPYKEYGGGIFLIRDLRDCIISETHRRWTKNHTELAENDQFRNYTVWSDLVSQLTKRWENMIQTWLRKENKILVVRYEDLKTDLANQMKRMLSFLNFTYTEEQMECVLNTNQNTFQRTSITDNKDKYERYYYTLELEKRLKSTLDNVRPILKSYGINYG